MSKQNYYSRNRLVFLKSFKLDSLFASGRARVQRLNYSDIFAPIKILGYTPSEIDYAASRLRAICPKLVGLWLVFKLVFFQMKFLCLKCLPPCNSRRRTSSSRRNDDNQSPPVIEEDLTTGGGSPDQQPIPLTSNLARSQHSPNSLRSVYNVFAR